MSDTFPPGYREGAVAFFNGRSVAENPLRGTMDGWNWWSGWHDAMALQVMMEARILNGAGLPEWATKMRQIERDVREPTT